MINLPILINHDYGSVIGKVSTDGNSLVVEFLPSANITKDMAFDILGHAAIQVLEFDGSDPNTGRIKKVRVLEFSLCPQSRDRISELERQNTALLPALQALLADADRADLKVLTECGTSIMDLRTLAAARAAIAKVEGATPTIPMAAPESRGNLWPFDKKGGAA